MPADSDTDIAAAAAPQERVPLKTKIAAGAGEGAINLGVNLPKNFSFLIYNLILGINPVLLGVALFIPRLWDAIIDPLMGNISDNTRSRFGRRKPYMLVGGILAAVGMALLCFVPSDIGGDAWRTEMIEWQLDFRWMFPGDEMGLLDLTASKRDYFYSGWLLVISLFFYTTLTIFAVPYGALTMELTRDYEERTRVMSFRTLFTYLTGFTMAWLFPLATSGFFDKPFFVDRFGSPELAACAVIGGILALIVLVCMMLPTLLVREPALQRKVARATPAQAASAEAKIGFIPALLATLNRPAFLMIIAAYTIGFLGVILVVGFGNYVAIFHVYDGDKNLGSTVQAWAQTVAILAGIGATFLINRFANRVEKKVLLIAALSSSFIGGLLTWVLYNPALPTGNLMAPLHWVGLAGEDAWLGDLNWPVHPLTLAYAMIWPGLAGLLIMSNSMIADICDIDELDTGKRREGMYWAVFNWIQKSAISIALLFSGVLLYVVDFDSTPDAIQSTSTIRGLRIAFMAGVCGGVGIAILIVAFLPLSKARLAAVRAELEARRHAPAEVAPDA